MHAMATATPKTAYNATRTAPSILSTGRLSAFRPVTKRAGRDIRGVAPRGLTLSARRLTPGGPGGDAENGTAGLLEGTSRSGERMCRRGPERRGAGGGAARTACAGPGEGV